MTCSRTKDDYIERVTEYFIEKRGRGTFVSPADLALIVEWEGAGVPAPAIARGIDRAVEAFGQVTSIRACRRFVAEEVRKTGARARPRPKAGTTQFRPTLEAAVFGLDELANRFPAADEVFRRAVERLGGVIEMVTAGEIDSVAVLVGELEIIEDKLADELMEVISDRELETLRKLVVSDMLPYRGKMDDADFEATVEATVRAAVLRRFDAKGLLSL